MLVLAAAVRAVRRRDAERQGHRRLALAREDPVATRRGRRLHVRLRQGDRGNDVHRPDVRDQPHRRRVAGLTFGAYHFGRPGGSGDAGIIANAIAQADYFLDVAQPQPESYRRFSTSRRRARSRAGLQKWTQSVARRGRRAHRRRSVRLRVAELLEDRARRHGRTLRTPATRSGSRTGRRTRPARSRLELGRPQLDVLAGSELTEPCPASRRRSTSTASTAPTRRRPRSRSYPSGLPQPSTVPTIVGTAQTGEDARRGAGRMGRRQAVALRVSVAALRRGRRRLRADCRCDDRDVPARDRRRRARAHGRGHGAERRRNGDRVVAAHVAVVELGLDGDASRRDLDADRHRDPQAGQTLTLGRRHLDRVADRVHLPVAALLGDRNAVRRDPRRGDVVVHADAGRHRRDDLARRHGDGQGRLDVRARADHQRRSSPRPFRRPFPALPSRLPELRVQCRRADGSATVTWQPGAVPVGLDGDARHVGPRPASSASRPRSRSCRGRSTSRTPRRRRASSARPTDNKVWRAAPHLATPALPVAELTGTYADAARPHPRPPPDDGAHRALRRGVVGRPEPRRRGPADAAPRRHAACDTAADGVGRRDGPRQSAVAGAPLREHRRQDARQALAAAPPRRRPGAGQRLRAPAPARHGATLRIAARDPYGRTRTARDPFRAP